MDSITVCVCTCRENDPRMLNYFMLKNLVVFTGRYMISPNHDRDETRKTLGEISIYLEA